MTPKEKAKEIFNQYWDLLAIHDVRNRRTFTKQCALIAVDEILNDDWYIQSFDDMMERKKYWQQVKNEIEKL